MGRPRRIVVLGSANLDLVVHQSRMARPGETMQGTSFTTGPGGKGLNQAIAAARAGGDVAFAGAVGDDDAGRSLRAALERNGIDTAALRILHTPSGTAHVTVLDDGENSIVVIPGANADTELDTRSRTAIARAGWLVVQLERPLDLVLAALREARTAGVTTVLTPAPVQRLNESALALVDLLVLNEQEAIELADATEPETAAAELSRSSGRVVMTRGARGALVARAGAIEAIVHARRVKPIDTTGAGDAFTGILVARLSLGAGLDAALEAASTGSAIAVTRPGAAAAMPSWDEISAFRGL